MMMTFKRAILVALMLGSTNAFALSAFLTGSYSLTEAEPPVNSYELATIAAMNILKDDIKENSEVFTSNISENERQLVISATPFVTYKKVTNKRIKNCPESLYGCALVDVTVIYDLSEIKKYVEQVALNAALKRHVQRLAIKESTSIKDNLSEKEKAAVYVKLEALIKAGGDSQTQTFMINDSYHEQKPLVESLQQILQKYEDFSKLKYTYSSLQAPLTKVQKKEIKKLNRLALEAAKSGYKIRAMNVVSMTKEAVILRLTTQGKGLNEMSYSLMDKSIGVSSVGLKSKNYYPVDNNVRTNIEHDECPASYDASGYEAGHFIEGIQMHFTYPKKPRVTPIRGIVLVQELYYGNQKKPFVTYPLAGDINGYDDKMYDSFSRAIKDKRWGTLYYQLFFPERCYNIRAMKPKGFDPHKNIPIKAKQRVINF